MPEFVGSDGETAGPGRSDFVQSLARGLAVIRAFGGDRPTLTLSEVARLTGLTRAAARRFLLTLVELGYVRSEGREFSLRPRVLELGFAYLSGLGLDEIAAPHVEALVARTRESSSIAVLDGDDIAYVIRVPTKRIMTVAISVGTRFPAYATSMGRVLLASLPEDQLEEYLSRVRFTAFTRRTVSDPAVLRRVVAEVAAQGFAVVDQELEDGLRSVAVPIRDARGHTMAAINVSVHVSRATLDVLRRSLLPQLQQTAASISIDLQVIRINPARPLRHEPK